MLAGFPRTAEQLTMLQHAGMAAPPQVVHLTLPRSEAEHKIAARRVCANCGEAMHELPAQPGAPPNLLTHLLEEATACDAPRPVRAAADAADVAARRLDAYELHTLPALERLRSRGAEVTKVAVLESVDETWRAIEHAFGLEPLESSAS